MKNAKESQLKKCIVLTCEEFADVIHDATNGLMYAKVDEDGEFDLRDSNDAYDKNEYIDDDVYKILSDYYNVEVESIHSDYCEYPMIWICYKD